jgi:hypothetical protein
MYHWLHEIGYYMYYCSSKAKHGIYSKGNSKKNMVTANEITTHG